MRVPNVRCGPFSWSWSLFGESPGAHAKLTDATAAALFGGLGACVREVDFVGWYREGYVAGAVLTQGGNASGERTASHRRAGAAGASGNGFQPIKHGTCACVWSDWAAARAGMLPGRSLMQ